jgi:hypothetical protein
MALLELVAGRQRETRDSVMRRVSLTEHDAGALGGTPTIPFDTHQRVKGTVGANATLTFGAPPAGVTTHCRLTITATAAATITLPAGMDVVGTLPDLTLANGNKLRVDAEYDGAAWTVGVAKITETT